MEVDDQVPGLQCSPSSGTSNLCPVPEPGLLRSPTFL